MKTLVRKKAKLLTKTRSGKRRSKGADRHLASVVKKLDITSLHSNDVTEVLLHCASALKLRNVIDRSNDATDASAGYCYTKSGSSTTVSIWHNGFKVGETSQANAEASGIRPCG